MSQLELTHPICDWVLSQVDLRIKFLNYDNN